MKTLLLDLIIPGSPRRPSGHFNLGEKIGEVKEVNPDTVKDTTNGVLDSLQQAGDQVTDTLAQGQTLLMDNGIDGLSSSMWTVAIAVVALVACISLAVAYRKKTKCAEC